MDLHANEIKGWDYFTIMIKDRVLKALSKLVILQAVLSIQTKARNKRVPIESFHLVLKKELIYQSKPKTFEETKKSLFKYIEGWYNNHRIQKKLGYLSPADYQKQVA